MDQERIGILLAKLLAGEATLPEQKELEMAFRDDPSLRETWDALRALKETPPTGLSVGEEQKMLERGLKRLELTRLERPVLSVATREMKKPAAAGKRAQEPATADSLSEETVVVTEEVPVPGRQEVIRLRRRMVAAAAILVLGVAGAVFYSGHKTTSAPSIPVVTKELVSKNGSRSFIELSDGSKLWLNAGSKVTYLTPFADGKRELTLSGEAYFDVKHDPAHPFVIHTGKLNVRVLGTTLNVKAYPGDSLTETTLIKGKVEVEFNNHTHTSVVLQPSEKLIVSTGRNQSDLPDAGRTGSSATPVKEQAAPKIVTTSVIPDSTDGTIEETSWVENKLVFRKEPFAQLALKLERWYNVKIRFDNEKYKMDELTGAFKDQRIGEVMQALQLTSAFHYRISGDTIHIW
jgi:ferric-dicitrate binding protein FerR (iron transport regulator)